MLKRLLIRNVALIESLELDFSLGLNVLSGETGAGKSIVVDAISFLLGGKADREMVRAGSPKAYVEGTFFVGDNQAAIGLLAQNDIDPEDSEVTLARELSLAGKSACRISGTLVSLPYYRSLADLLMDIHGQHEHQSLLNERSHVHFVDGMGDSGHLSLLRSVYECHAEYAKCRENVERLTRTNAERQERMIVLQTKEKDLAGTKVEAGEEELLRAKLDNLRNADKIMRSLEAAFFALYESDGDQASVLVLLQNARRALDSIKNYDESYARMEARLSSLYYEAEDLGQEMRKALGALDRDENSRQRLEDRFDLIKRLSRKYSVPCDEMPGELERVREELRKLESVEEDLAAAENDSNKRLNEYRVAAKALSTSRISIARHLESRLEEELSELNMKGTAICVEVDAAGKTEPAANGLDNVRILIAPNVGEELKPLARIASGGELSRLMLALKTISAEKNIIPAMVFDEIDSGISGRTAQVVAEKLWEIARYRQVFCVTHLQQIAAMASSQYLVSKHEVEGRTATSVTLLDDDERVAEIARIVSGINQHGKSGMTHARIMLDDARELRKRRQAVS